MTTKVSLSNQEESQGQIRIRSEFLHSDGTWHDTPQCPPLVLDPGRSHLSHVHSHHRLVIEEIPEPKNAG